VTVTLVCTGRRRPHRTVVIYHYDGPVPVPLEHGWTGSHYTFDLWCKRCRAAPRPSDETMRALIAHAAANDGVFDLADVPL
jgi:hypothetical protein